MQGKQKIIDDILSSARSAASDIVAEAEESTRVELEELRAELDAAQKESLEKAEAAAQELYAGQVKLGELEANKAILSAKQACVSAVYYGVKRKILAAKDAEYLKILQAVIVKYCEDGDQVIAAKSDKRVTAEWVKKVSTAAKKKLVLSKEKGDFEGGVILRNDKFDRDLTVDSIVEELKERTVFDTVSRLGL
ncbi:MAG: V-type ATP synthase subunit E [Clostridiales bacterium]|nr:V-type ATP synthase subunit E [Clostridiales bacterium]